MSNLVPSYRRHRQSGQAIVTLYDGTGRRRDVILGPYGSSASRDEYKRVISEWRGAKDTIREDWAAFLRWIQTHRMEFAVIILIIGTVIALATRWAINEYRIYHP